MQIVMRQISGLGNQLFQYAAARYYAQRYDAPFRLATDLAQNQFSHGYPRPFLLSHFSIPVPMQPLSRLERALFSRSGPMRAATSLLSRPLGIQVFTEPIAQRHKLLQEIPLERGVRTLYLFGYWQVLAMVEAVATDLREDLRLRVPAEGRNLEMLERIAQCRNPVSLHVRRGDYTLTAEASVRRGEPKSGGGLALPIDYYARASRYFEERLEDPTFFIFSDDIPFTRTHLPPGVRTVFVEGNADAAAHEDLRLMSACRHHIIANSSFSWWGAWLNARPDKQVYAPRYWLNQPGSYYAELVSPDWILDDGEEQEAARQTTARVRPDG